MRIPLVLLSFLPLLLSSCPEEEEEREWERQADEDTRGCRSCSMVEILADGNCPIGYECNPEWKMTSNVLSPNDCSCSVIRCANQSTILAVEEKPVGMIRCKAQEWTLQTDPTKTTTSAVCAKSCGVRVCQRQHFKQSNSPLYEPLKIKEPSLNDPCASAECPKGFVVLDDDGEPAGTHPPTPLVCSSTGNWKFGAEEERYVMCKKNGLTSFEPIPVHTCQSQLSTYCIVGTCSDGITETETSITCPSGECILVIAKEDPTLYGNFEKAEYDNSEMEWIFYREGEPYRTQEELEANAGGKLILGCSTWCVDIGGCEGAKLATASARLHLRRQESALASVPHQTF